MDLNTITVADFKAQFSRDFPYLPVWSVSVVYNAEAIVYYTNGLFYKAKSNGIPAGTVPTNVIYWDLYPDDVDNYVLDSDITKAFAEAQMVFNQSLFGTDAQITLAYLYLTAFYLVNDLRTSAAGIGSQGQFPVNSKTMGSVSEAYTVPQKYLDNPLLALYTNNGYGMKYLSFALPRLVGNIGAVCGWTLP